MEPSSILMKIKNLLLLFMFAAGGSASLDVKANAVEQVNIQQLIRNKVNEHKYEINAINKDNNRLKELFAKLKPEFISILNSAGNLSPRHQALKNAIENLDLDISINNLSMGAHINTILENLDSDIADTIKKAIPPFIKNVLGIK